MLVETHHDIVHLRFQSPKDARLRIRNPTLICLFLSIHWERSIPRHIEPSSQTLNDVTHSAIVYAYLPE